MKSLLSLVLISFACSRTHYHRPQRQGVLVPCAAVTSCPAAAERRTQAFNMRVARATSDLLSFPCQSSNGDEQAYPVEYLGSFTKGLRHNLTTGVVDAAAMQEYMQCIQEGNFSKLHLAGQRKLTNPQAGLMFELWGGDTQSFGIRAAPALASAEAAADLVELYWAALLRDVPFDVYSSSSLVAEAVADMNRLSDYRGSKPVTAQNLFRSTAVGSDVGPYLSQFWFANILFGAHDIDMRVNVTSAGNDFMTNWEEFVAIQNGAKPNRTQQVSSELRYLLTARDLGRFVHVDVLFQAYFEGMLGLFNMGIAGKSDLPYGSASHYAQEDAFGTYGPPAIASYLAAVSGNALRVAWYQKWYVNRRLRPEAMAGRVDRTLRGIAHFPLHRDVLNSSVLSKLFAAHSSYLLPQAFPEGSPLHPSYLAGHATVAGACTTLLKAFFDESAPFPNPVVTTADGKGHVAYTGPLLTIGGELNKLAANVAIGRNLAGVHYRSDGEQSMKMGEQVAIAILRDIKASSHETFPGFRFTSFDGTPVVVN